MRSDHIGGYNNEASGACMGAKWVRAAMRLANAGLYFAWEWQGALHALVSAPAMLYNVSAGGIVR